MDVFGHHASVCPTKGDRIRRHNVLRDIIYDFALLHLGVLKKKPHTFSLHLLKDQQIYLSQITRWEKIWFLMLQLLAHCNTNITTVQLNQRALLATPMLTRWKSRITRKEWKMKAVHIFRLSLNHLEGFRKISLTSFLNSQKGCVYVYMSQNQPSWSTCMRTYHAH